MLNTHAEHIANVWSDLWRCNCYESVWGILGLWLHVVWPTRDDMEAVPTLAAHRLMEDQRERNSSPQTRAYPSEGLVNVKRQV
jgi:hypothetical protein